jgi:hypothetical protein
MQEPQIVTKKRNWAWLYVLIGFLLTAAIVAGVFWWQQTKVDKLQQDLNKTKTELQKERQEEEPAAVTPSVSDFYELALPQIDMKFAKVPKELPGLTYKYTDMGTYDVVAFSSTKMTAYCSLDGTDSPLGVLFKRTGVYPTSEGPKPELIKQYDGFYIAYREPQQTCSAEHEAAVETAQDEQVPLLRDALASLEIVQ